MSDEASHPPFDLTRFHNLLETKRFGRNLVFEPTVGSTMDLARDAAHHGAAEGTVALADEQTAGRGRLGRSWITPRASNLTFTVVLRPPRHVLRQVAMLAPLAVALAVEEATGVRTAIKWPNDVHASGRKLAGVLIETESDGSGEAIVLAGIGLNVNFDPREYAEIRDIATSLSVETGHPVDREPLLATVMLHFERLYDEAKAGGSLRDRWRERLAMLGQAVKVAAPGRTIEGTAEDVDDDGSLLVRTASGDVVAIEAGDVTLRE